MNDLFKQIFSDPINKNNTPDFRGVAPQGYGESYRVKFGDYEYDVNYDPNDGKLDEKDRVFIATHLYIWHGLLFSGTFPQPLDGFNVTMSNLGGVIESGIYPKTSIQKRNHLLEYIHSKQGYDGSPLRIIYGTIAFDLFRYKNFLKNDGEILFYLKTLSDSGFLHFFSNGKIVNGGTIDEMRITFKGIEFVESLYSTGPQSKKCFIAMSFNEKAPKILSIEETIKKVIRECEYEPVIIKDQHINSDRTINDQIIAEIRGCKFMIADFTEQKAGVYFESGFALGLGRPVIYTVHQNDLANSHFDTKPLQHIVYENMEELEFKLTNKIKAWIE